MMQRSAELLSALGAVIDETKAHIRRMDDLTLQALAANLPPRSPAGTAEMLMLLLVFREAESRERRNQGAKVLNFPQLGGADN